MKKLNKVLAALLVMGATAVPAMAIEHEVSGMFQTFFEDSNYSASGLVEDNAPDANWFDQRLRLGYQAKAKDVKLVTKFEIDYTFWGNSSYATGRGTGAAIGADSVNIETKNIYLDWNLPEQKLNAKVGMQGYDDFFSGILFSADMAGGLLTHQCNDNLSTALGFFRWNDSGYNDGGVQGQDTQDVYVLTAKYDVSKEFKVGGAYYYMSDDREFNEYKEVVVTDADGDLVVDSEFAGVEKRDAKVHTIGLNAEYATDSFKVNGFVLGQFGEYDQDNDAKGYAAKLAARTSIGKGTLRGDALYVAGGSNQIYSNPDESGYYDNEMMIISRDKNATTIDNALVYSASNNFIDTNEWTPVLERAEGVVFLSLGYDQPFSDTLTGSLNVGYAMVASNEGDNEVNPANDYINENEDEIGTEVNVELVKQATENLTLSARAAYVFLGDHYNSNPGTENGHGNPEDPYAVQLLMRYSF